jgi:hypothetical protein
MIQMKKRTTKFAALALLASGTLFQLGCLNLGGLFNNLVGAVPAYIALEFLTDGDGFFGFGLQVPAAE